MRIRGRNENTETPIHLGMRHFPIIPAPRQKIGFSHRIVMNGDKEVTTGSLSRTLSQTADPAVNIDFAYRQGSLMQGLAQAGSQFAIEQKLGPPTRADRTAILQPMAHIDRNLARMGKCCGQHEKMAKMASDSSKHFQLS